MNREVNHAMPSPYVSLRWYYGDQVPYQAGLSEEVASGFQVVPDFGVSYNGNMDYNRLTGNGQGCYNFRAAESAYSHGISKANCVTYLRRRDGPNGSYYDKPMGRPGAPSNEQFMVPYRG